MTEHVLQQQQVENNYIDSLLNATHRDVGSVENAGATFPPDSQQQIENESIENKPIAMKTDKSITADPGVSDDGLYQLVLVDGLKLAIPLSEITLAVDGSNTIIKGDMFFHHGEQLTIVNLISLIGAKDKVLDASTDSKQYLLIQHRQLAIECQQILEMETIDENLVCWRSENSQRKWLAGTIKQQGIAILDLAMLQQMHSV